MVDVAFTPRDLGSADVAVVVDVLRATTTIAAALAAGHRRVLCTEEVEAAERLRGPNRLLAGERTDAAIMAELVTASYADPRAALTTGANARKLLETDQEADIDYCARESILNVVPRVSGTMPGVAFVSAGTASRVHAVRPRAPRSLDHSL